MRNLILLLFCSLSFFSSEKKKGCQVKLREVEVAYSS